MLLILLVLFLIGAFPTWPHSANWGYYPSGGLGTVLIVVIVLVLRTTSVSTGYILVAPVIGWVLCAPKYLASTMSLGEVPGGGGLRDGADGFELSGG